MTKENDISNLFKGIGVDGSSYKELAAEREVDASLDRWSLLASVHRQRSGPAPKPVQAPSAEPVWTPAQVQASAPVSSVAPSATATNAVPISSLFQRISRADAAERREPVVPLSAWQAEPQPPSTASKPPRQDVQSLFSRLENKAQEPAVDSPASGGLSLFQRLIQK